MIPRWLAGLVILGIIIWFFSDPAGFADMLIGIKDAFKIFFGRLFG